MIIIKNLTKKYRNKKIIDKLNFEVSDNKVTVLIGPNGAGKTTTINCITNFLKFDGDIYIDGYKNCSIEAKKSLGYIPDTSCLYEYLTVIEHIEFIAKAYSILNWEPYANELLERFNLIREKNKLCKELSKGMKQKVSICCALIHRPKTIIFDEPFVGLDPVSIKELKNMILELQNEGCAILISTHILDTVSDLWDETYILDKGKIISHLESSVIDKKRTLEEIFFSLNIKLGD